MATSQRIHDAADLLKLLTQSTQDATPDNPAEQLSDFVPAPTTGTDDIALSDSITTPNTPFTPPYQWSTSPAKWNLASWS